MYILLLSTSKIEHVILTIENLNETMLLLKFLKQIVYYNYKENCTYMHEYIQIIHSQMKFFVQICASGSDILLVAVYILLGFYIIYKSIKR